MEFSDYDVPIRSQQSGVSCLKSLSNEFGQDISEDRGYCSYSKIGSGQDIFEPPSCALFNLIQ